MEREKGSYEIPQCANVIGTMAAMIPEERSPQIPSSSHVRWIILALLFWVSMSNFLDRSVFGNLSPEMPQYLHLADNVKSADVDLYWSDHSSEVLAAVHATRQ